MDFFLHHLEVHIKDVHSLLLDSWYLWLAPTPYFSESWKPTQHSIFLSFFGVRGDSRRWPYGMLISHHRSRMYSNISTPVSRRRERTRGDYELNVDLSSAGCRSKEQHWQAEHTIHQSLLSLPSSSFSEVDEHIGARLEARSTCICSHRVRVSGGGEVRVQVLCLKAKIWSFENVTTVPGKKPKIWGREWRRGDE